MNAVLETVRPPAYRAQKQANLGFLLTVHHRFDIADKTWHIAGFLPHAKLASTGTAWRNLTNIERERRILAVTATCASDFDEALTELQRELEQFLANCAAENLALTRKLATRLASGNHSLLELKTNLPAQLKQLRENRQREILAASIREAVQLDEYPETFPVAGLPRKFIAVLGPTNSGKTHKAFERLAVASSGIYLGPLRLLALEAYTRLNNEFGVVTSLITGEERRINPDAKVTASTVEMLSTIKRVEVAVIDEVQMLADRDRGWAWTQAIIGANAEEIWLLGSSSARPALQVLAERLGVEIEFHEVTRKAPLRVASAPLSEQHPSTALRQVQPGDALIVFSRRDALALRDDLLAKGFSVACIYGALGPEIREREAERFASGSAQVLVATDAIGMGLNLPIRRIVFTSVQKYDGESRDDLPVALLHQIAGRAGRFRHHEDGIVVGLTHDEHSWVVFGMDQRLALLPTTGFSIAPNLGQLMGISVAAKETRLAVLLTMFVQHANTGSNKLFVARVQDDQMTRADLADKIDGLTLSQKHTLSMVPMSTREFEFSSTWSSWAHAVAAQRQVNLRFAKEVPIARADLGQSEQMVRLLAAYRWLAFRLPQYFPEEQEAEKQTDAWCAVVEAHLKSKARQSQARNGRSDLPNWYWEYRESWR